VQECNRTAHHLSRCAFHCECVKEYLSDLVESLTNQKESGILTRSVLNDYADMLIGLNNVVKLHDVWVSNVLHIHSSTGYILDTIREGSEHEKLRIK